MLSKERRWIHYLSHKYKHYIIAKLWFTFTIYSNNLEMRNIKDFFEVYWKSRGHYDKSPYIQLIPEEKYQVPISSLLGSVHFSFAEQQKYSLNLHTFPTSINSSKKILLQIHQWTLPSSQSKCAHHFPQILHRFSTPYPHFTLPKQESLHSFHLTSQSSCLRIAIITILLTLH